jgi:hypothetical protein
MKRSAMVSWTVHPAALIAAMGACLCLPVAAFGLESSTLTMLTVEQAHELMAKKTRPGEDLLGARVSLDRLKTLSPEVAEVLIECSEFPLSFDGLEDLSAETATVLARQKPVAAFGCADLRLNGLKVITPAAAEALAAHRGMVLLHSLHTLDSVPLARKLAGQWGELRLGLRELSPEIAAELAKHGGFRGDKTRSVVKYRREDDAASVLRIDMLTSLSLETAEALAAHEGVLVLNGLVSLDPAVAAALAKRVGNRKNSRAGTLVLNGLPAISTDVATALAAFPGELVLKGITELSPEAAMALATHKGRLHLTGLTMLSAEARVTLQGHTDVLLPRSPVGAPR